MHVYKTKGNNPFFRSGRLMTIGDFLKSIIDDIDNCEIPVCRDYSDVSDVLSAYQKARKLAYKIGWNGTQHFDTGYVVPMVYCGLRHVVNMYVWNDRDGNEFAACFRPIPWLEEDETVIKIQED